ncbi:Gpi16 subunit GPI transamidase component [Mycena rebaudengoi]|nr:Gpi16 subunit GPI transamidase component [Mycena rebaudengoi]
MIYWNARCLWALSLAVLGLASETFEEKLTIRTLRDGKVASRFSFATVLEGAAPRNPQNLSAEDDSQHYTLFPLTLGQILREYAVTELHLTLNAGKWDYTRWGHPAEPDVATGAELWAWMGDGAEATIDERWRAVRNQLAGLFCASLGSLDELRTTAPDQAFAPRGGLQNYTNTNTNNHAIRHASLPSEHVCTENLTPFLKLLPCKSLSGIACLLNPHRLFDADWHGMALHVVWLPNAGVQVRMTFQSVSDPLRPSGTAPDWSLSSLFGRPLARACPIARSSRVEVVLPTSGGYSITPEPDVIEGAEREAHDSVAIFDLALRNPSDDAPLDVSMRFPEYDSRLATAAADPDSSPESTPENKIIVHRTLHGSTQSHGVLAVRLSNPGAVAVEVAYLETLPWIVQLYVHTLRVSVHDVPRQDLLRSITYTPPVPHSRATTFRAVVALPPRSTVHLSIGIAKAFLRYTEHPPDAQRGWDLPAAVVVVLPSDDTRNVANASLNGGSRSGPNGGAEEEYGDAGTRIYTPTLLVDLSTPDFSMPYNVIIFSSSLVAFIFGSIFNLLTRKFVVLKVEGNK